MRELISQPGLKFYLFELHGTLKYSIARPNCPPKTDILSTADYPSHGDVDVKVEGAELEDGEDAVANGLAIRILKNEGRFSVKFRGDAGADVEWVFEGLEVVSTST